MNYRIRKGINAWSFDQDLSFSSCMGMAKEAGFEGIELVLASKGDITMDATESKMLRIREEAERIGISINSLATGLYWQFSLTSDRKDIRERALSVARKQIDIARWLGADCVLVCPGAVGVDFKPEEVVPDAESIEFFAGSEVIPYDVAYERSLAGLRELAPYAEANKVNIGVENIWNRFLLSPLEFKAFIDEIASPFVGVYFDVGNIVATGYPEQWIRILGKRIKKLHFKDYRRAVGSLAGFVDLLAGDVNWPAVVSALEEIGYDGWANAEMCPVYAHYSSQIVFNTSQTMDRILKRK